jgi:predicted transposase YbfD/YdcC
MSKRPSRSRFFPLASFDSGVEKAHGRIERRVIDVLPATVAGIDADWPTVNQVCRVTRWRQRKENGKWQQPQAEIVYLITSLTACQASPKALLQINRDHWGVEIMHRDKDVTLGEDGYTNRLDNAPRNVFSLACFALKILRSVSHSPTRAIEHFQDDRNRATRLFSGFH